MGIQHSCLPTSFSSLCGGSVYDLLSEQVLTMF